MVLSLFFLLLLGAIAAFWILQLQARVREKQEQARRLSGLLRSSYESALDGLVSISSEGYIIALNDRARNQFGITLEVGDAVAHFRAAVVASLSAPQVSEEMFSKAAAVHTAPRPREMESFELVLRGENPRVLSVGSFPCTR